MSFQKPFTICCVVLLIASAAHAQRTNPLRNRGGGLTIPQVEKRDIICFAFYTVHNKTLKLTAQLYPIADGDTKTVRLEIEKDGEWVEVGRTNAIERGWTALFRVENWDDSKKYRYRVAHGSEATYEGTIRKNPIDKAEIIVAGFTGNSISPRHGGDISREDILENVKRIDADVLFFSGDQVYDHNRHYAAWLKFGRDFGEIIKDRPTLCLPDDHDVGQPNLWGERGKISTLSGAADGGYSQPGVYVREVERAQTSHFPDPADPHKIGQDIGVWFTNLHWGNVDFAILEDRKFKTGPAGRVPKQGPRPDHIRNPEYDPASVDVSSAVLLGERQLNFLDAWSQDWRHAKMKIAVSQTIFCGGAHIHVLQMVAFMLTWIPMAGRSPAATVLCVLSAKASPSTLPETNTWQRSSTTASTSTAMRSGHSVCRRLPTSIFAGGNRSSRVRTASPGLRTTPVTTSMAFTTKSPTTLPRIPRRSRLATCSILDQPVSASFVSIRRLAKSPWSAGLATWISLHLTASSTRVGHARFHNSTITIHRPGEDSVR